MLCVVCEAVVCEAGYTRGVVKLVVGVKYSAGVRAEG